MQKEIIISWFAADANNQVQEEHREKLTQKAEESIKRKVFVGEVAEKSMKKYNSVTTVPRMKATGQSVRRPFNNFGAEMDNELNKRTFHDAIKGLIDMDILVTLSGWQLALIGCFIILYSSALYFLSRHFYRKKLLETYKIDEEKHYNEFLDVLENKRSMLDELKKQDLKEIILFLVSELLINQHNTDATRVLTNDELLFVAIQARTATRYCGTDEDVERMLKTIDYLANDAWVKVYGRPCIQCDLAISRRLIEIENYKSSK